MKNIRRSTAPRDLEQANRAGRDWTDWDRAIRTSIRDQLRDDQLGVCAYCERRIMQTRDDDVVIEHFHPRSDGLLWERRSQSEWTASSCGQQSGAPSHLKSTTAWTNLLLSCPGKGPSRSDGKIETTCDRHKGSTDICESFHNPKLSHLEQLIDIDRGGRAVPSAGMPADASRIVNEVLNLNAQFLIEDRRSLIAAQIREYNKAKDKHKGLTAKQKLQIAARIRDRAQQPGTAYRSALLSYANEIDAKA